MTAHRCAAVLAGALLTTGVFASAAQAADGGRGHEKTRLNATAYYGSLDPLARQTHGLKARFVKTDGTPVEGLPVKFTVSGEKTFLCNATTDSDGYAECKNSPLPLGVPTVKALLYGYDATFEGNAHYAPVNAHNSIGVP
ncbi:hypothetical protein AB8O64_21690 [Streptomyces sp. QH1-20]|uniref:hypothetical protein n=1 Tax=Streptomyces sp. QH1-20 TaxID=3240934 RepID=UPI0035112DDE